MNLPSNLRYTRNHEWILLEKDIATIGITDFAQKQLGDIVFIETPDQGIKLNNEAPFGSVESVEAVTDLFCPVGGTVVEINEEARDAPELLNEDPYGDGWILKLKVDDPSTVNKLMDAAAYAKFCEE